MGVIVGRHPGDRTSARRRLLAECSRAGPAGSDDVAGPLVSDVLSGRTYCRRVIVDGFSMNATSDPTPGFMVGVDTNVTRRRRANGEGSIWREGAYFVGRISIEGRRHQVKGKTGEAVAEKIFALRQKAANGTLPTARGHCTVSEWLEVWLSGLFVDPRTLRGYREHARLHLAPAFGHMQLPSLTTQEIRIFCQRAMTPREQGGSGLHQTTVHNIGMTLRIALGGAVEAGLIAQNPAAIRRTIPSPATREMLSWEPDECRRFLTAAAGHPHETLFQFALATGARQGEIRALRWSAVDLDHATVSITASMSTGHRRKGTKTSHGDRLLHLPPHLVQLLAAHKAGQKVVPLGQDDLVFPNDVGHPFSACSVGVRTMEPLMRKAQVRRIRFHDLRHTFATLMLRNGVPIKDVAYTLGHSDAATTLRVYAHAVPSTHAEHAAIIGAILTGASSVAQVETAPCTSETEEIAAVAVSATRRGDRPRLARSTPHDRVRVGHRRRRRRDSPQAEPSPEPPSKPRAIHYRPGAGQRILLAPTVRLTRRR